MNAPRITDAIANADEYIAYLQTLPDVQLQKSLRIIRAQQQIAWNQKDVRGLEQLEIWERQVIEARYLRNEDDAPTSSSPKPQKKKIIKEKRVQSFNEVVEETESPVSEFEEMTSAPTQMTLF